MLTHCTAILPYGWRETFANNPEDPLLMHFPFAAGVSDRTSRFLSTSFIIFQMFYPCFHVQKLQLDKSMIFTWSLGIQPDGKQHVAKLW